MPITPGTKLRRVVTTHLSDKSAILLDEEIKPFQAFASEAATIWKNHQYPAELLSIDPVDSNPEIYTKGSLIRVVDFPPHSKGHNHRTASLDYGIILSGELEMVLEDGSRTIVRSGDVVVQQAVGHLQNLAVSFFMTDCEQTMHQWNNLTDQSTRVIFLLVPSQKPLVNGIQVAESGVPGKYLPAT